MGMERVDSSLSVAAISGATGIRMSSCSLMFLTLIYSAILRKGVSVEHLTPIKTDLIANHN